jgi:tetratricopeptide (TPR) repeat protein
MGRTTQEVRPHKSFEDTMKSTLFVALALCAIPSFAATPAEIAIQQALGNIEKQPAHYPYYNALAMAYARRARETADAGFYAKAEETLRKSFAISPANFEGLKVEAWLQLGRHEFASALETATRLNKIAPDDVAVYGYLVDANVELGNYKEAIGAAQWMLDLREGNVPGLTRAAYLRELHGNLSGALELMQRAFDALPPAEAEDRVWILAQMAHLELLSGELPKAETYATAALAAFPDYPYALTALAQVRSAQSRYPENVNLLHQRYDAAPNPEILYALAEAQELAGQHQEASASFQEFERQSRAQSTLALNSNRQLIFYYLDHAGQPAKALEIARREVAVRQDIFTLDSYAWALAGNGDYEAAGVQLQKALAMNVKEPAILFHAGAIALHLHENDKAEAYLKDAAARYSREAANLLAGIRGESPAGER